MNKLEFLKMLIQDNETEQEPTKELHEAVIEVTVEALSQAPDDMDIDATITLKDLYNVILQAGKASKATCVSPFKASELIAQKLGADYKRPINKLKAQLCVEATVHKHSLEDFL